MYKGSGINDKNDHICKLFDYKTIVYMKIDRLFCASVLALGLLCAFSCKKEEDPVVSNSLKGSLDFDLPSFVTKGEHIKVVPRGVTTKSGGTDSLGFFWKVEPFMKKADTVRVAGDPASKNGAYEFVIPDTLCTVTVSGAAFAAGYYNSPKSKKMDIIDPSHENGSLRGFSFGEGDSKFVDPRDSHEYFVARIGKMDWMKENLAWVGAGRPYAGEEATSAIFGRMYTWAEAQTVCPEGWRLPTQQDWLDAVKVMTPGFDGQKNLDFTGVAGAFMGDLYFNGNKLWEFWPAVKITDASRLALIPTGYAILDGVGGSEFDQSLQYATAWTADAYDEEKAYYRYVFVQRPDIYSAAASKTMFAASVRCIRDAR